MQPPEFMRKRDQQATEPRKCLMCPAMLTGNLKWYHSGECMIRAKERGIYGNEQNAGTIFQEIKEEPQPIPF